MFEMGLWFIREFFFLLLCILKIQAIGSFVEAEVDRDPSWIANKVDKFLDLWLHGRNTLYTR